MVSQHALSLAASIITSHFGDLVGKVCRCLLQHGTLSLHEIVRFSELSTSQVKNSLLVLIQHNCVQAFSTPRPAVAGVEVKTVTLYMALLDNILHRVRFSKFLAIVEADLGVQCRNVLEGMLQHGRLTFEQLAVREISKKQSDGNTRSEDALRVDFNKLVDAHYVECCPRPEPFVTPVENPMPSRTKRAKSVEVALSLEQLAMISAALSEAQRFSKMSDMGADGMLESQDLKHYEDISIGHKRKHEALEIDKETQAAITEIGVLWRANFEKFIYCLKKKACVVNVRSRLGLDAGVILEAMIETNISQKDKNCVQSSIDKIIEAARGKPGGIAMTMDHVRAILEKLGAELCSEETGLVYSIELKNIIQKCQNDEVESLIRKKYGEVTYRIFRLLTKTGMQEMDQISDTTLIEKKTVQTILYKLWKDGYLEIKKVVAQGSGQTQHFFWSLDRKELQEHTLNDMYHAALNLCQKTADVFKQEQEALQDKVKRQCLQRGRLILESSLLKLDDSLMLFNDF